MAVLFGLISMNIQNTHFEIKMFEIKYMYVE